jgi:hypothetical protein
MEGINQVNVNQKAKLTFAEGLRSILRQDTFFKRHVNKIKGSEDFVKNAVKNKS